MRGPSHRRAALARGAEAEAFVGRALEREGWEVLARNWRGGGGELDLIVRQGGRVRFVEVKAREDGDPSGLEAVEGRKIDRLVRAAETWLMEQPGEPEEVCFLVAIVTCAASGWTVEWFDDAFDG